MIATPGATRRSSSIAVRSRHSGSDRSSRTALDGGGWRAERVPPAATARGRPAACRAGRQQARRGPVGGQTSPLDQQQASVHRDRAAASPLASVGSLPPSGCVLSNFIAVDKFQHGPGEQRSCRNMTTKVSLSEDSGATVIIECAVRRFDPGSYWQSLCSFADVAGGYAGRTSREWWRQHRPDVANYRHREHCDESAILEQLGTGTGRQTDSN